jgi:hypothetical protein
MIKVSKVRIPFLKVPRLRNSRGTPASRLPIPSIGLLCLPKASQTRRQYGIPQGHQDLRSNAGIPPHARQFPGLVELASATVRPPIECGLSSPMGVMLPWEFIFTLDFWACSLIAICPEASPIAFSSFVSASFGYAFAQNRSFYNQTYFSRGPSSRHAFEARYRLQ